MRVRVLISGQVQGVFFRQTTRELAEKEALAGWVRNRPDGHVEAVFEGPQEAVDRLVAWCHEGPPWAKVVTVEVLAEEPRGEAGFEIR